MRAHRVTPLLALALTLSSCGGPDTEAEQLPPATPARDRLVLAIHGGGDDPQVWAEGLLDALGPRLPSPARWERVAYDWEDAASNRSKAAKRGLALGEELAGELLAMDPPYEHVLIIAHSVGAFVAHGLSVELGLAAGGPRVHVIFLDPFTMRGVFDWDHGQSLFGQGAAVAESYYNSDDPAPTTNEPLEHARNVDVTALRPGDLDEDSWHWWPIDAWLELLDSPREGVGLDIVRRAVEGRDVHGEFPRGETLLSLIHI